MSEMYRWLELRRVGCLGALVGRLGGMWGTEGKKSRSDHIQDARALPEPLFCIG